MKFLFFLGTARNSTPPAPARLGVRVVEALLTVLKSQYETHDITLIDVLDYPLDAVFKPHFAYAKIKHLLS